MPSEAFAERLDLLLESGQITPRARELTEDVVERIEREFSVTLDETHGAQFVTHLAMALGRLDGGDVETQVSGVVEEEIRGRDHERAFMQRTLAECGERLERDVPEAEISYMTVHLCALTD